MISGNSNKNMQKKNIPKNPNKNIDKNYFFSPSIKYSNYYIPIH